MIQQSLFQSDFYERRKHIQNIIFTGGNSKIYDSNYSLKNALENYLPSSYSFTLHTKPEIPSASWRGTMALANTSSPHISMISL
jgi:actin-related protein